MPWQTSSLQPRPWPRKRPLDKIHYGRLQRLAGTLVMSSFGNVDKAFWLAIVSLKVAKNLSFAS